MTEQQFHFADLIRSHDVRVANGELRFRRFPGWRRVELSRLEAFYVDRGDELHTLSWCETGGRRRRQISARPGHGDFDALVDALAQACPDADLRDASPDVAQEKIGKENVELATLPMVGVLFIIMSLLLTLPQLLHGLDSSSSSIAVEALAAGELPESHNLEIAGQLRPELGTVVAREDDKAIYLVPMVSRDWTPDTPVRVVVQTRLITPDELSELAQTPSVAGILRNVLWEGLKQDQREVLGRSTAFALADDPLLVELGADASDELTLALAFCGIMAFIFLVVILALWLRTRPRKA